MTYRPPRRFTISFSLLTVLSNSPVAAANAARSSLPYNVQIYRYCYYYCCWIIIEVIFDYCYSTTIVVILCKHGISIQYSTVQYSTVQYSTVQYSTAQYSTVHYFYPSTFPTPLQNLMKFPVSQFMINRQRNICSRWRCTCQLPLRESR